VNRVNTSGWLLAAGLVLALATGAAADDDASRGPWLGIRLGGSGSADGGVSVSRVFNGSPAERAGLRARDVIVTFGGEPVTGPGDLVDKIRSREPGAWLPLTVLRQDEEIDLDVRLGERPARVPRNGIRRGWIGIEAIELPASLREHFGAPADAGVMISEVAVSSPAEAAGFRLGDVVYEVGGEPVGSVPALRESVEGGGVGNEYEFSVARDGAVLVLETKIAAAPPRER
jgi:S1-C subfamily serine protease